SDPWRQLEQQVAHCTACQLHEQRTQTVFGVGNRHAEWLVIGEAPGAEEDQQGEPFVGRAGQLLNAMLLAMGLLREQVYIANIVKCRPPQNRDPRPEEAASCAGYLRRQIELIQPKIILVVGRIAAQNLLGTEEAIGKLRLIKHRYGTTQIPVVATYHPAYLLRSPLEKRKGWQDLQFAYGVYKSAV
ncbi:MAG: DNA polymerase bacteriophage-type, partial [Halothiobacillaceae bacterium]